MLSALMTYEGLKSTFHPANWCAVWVTKKEEKFLCLSPCRCHRILLLFTLVVACSHNYIMFYENEIERNTERVKK
jgi:hypothetical protein